MDAERWTPPPVVALPVVCDTFHASFDAGIAGWLLQTLTAAQSVKEGVPLVWNPAAGEVALWAEETAPVNAWTVKRCDLAGYGGAYEFTARGSGVWSGVVLAIGQPRDERSDPETMRRVRVMLGSELLWRNRVKGGSAYDAMRGMIDALAMPGSDDANVIVSAPPDDLVKPSRLDVCRDHFGYEWTGDDLHRFACRQRWRGGVETYRPEDRFWDRPEHTSRFDGATTSTYYVGKRGARNRFMRVYDKTEEAAVTGKLPWLEPLWESFGWRHGQKVWRLEVEHGSEWLAEHGCAQLGHVVGFEEVAWQRYVEAVRHTTSDDRKVDRMDRASTSEVWKALASVQQVEFAAWRWQPRTPARKRDQARMAKQAAGCAAKILPMWQVPSAEDHPQLKVLAASATTLEEAKQSTLAFLSPLIEESLRKQAEASINALAAALYERAHRHIPKEPEP